MTHHHYLEKVIGPSDSREKIKAVRALAPFTDDLRVMEALCEAAVTTTSHRLREHLIEALKFNPAGACMRFAEEALWSPTPSRRQWALVNLSLLDCREASEAVIHGLNDPHASVRRAAAMSAGLYDDAEVLRALERYFEKHRFELTLSFIGAGVNALRKKPVQAGHKNGSRHPAGVADSSFPAIGG